jgi:hypothetical protein
LDKLFHVLVVLGAASCGEDDTSRRDREVDAAVSTDGAVSTPDAPDQEGAPCFCNVDACCDRTGATPVLQPGFTCCWSTTCD